MLRCVWISLLGALSLGALRHAAPMDVQANLLLLSIEMSTVKGYGTAWRHYLRFCLQLCVHPWQVCLPFVGSAGFLEVDHRLCQFVVYLFQHGLRSKTCGAYVNGVRQVHLVQLGFDPFQLHTRFKRLLEGIRRAEKRAGIATDRKLPFTHDMVRQGRRFIDFSHSSARGLFTAMSTGVAFLLRASELVVRPNSNHHVLREDVSFVCDAEGVPQIVMLWVRSSKTSSDPVQLALRVSEDLLGVGRLLFEWLALWDGPGSAPLFPGVTQRCLARLTKSLAVRLGFHGEEHAFATHSLRRGGAVSLKLAGFPDSYIQQFGRWKSDMWQEVYAALKFELQLRMVDSQFGVPGSSAFREVGCTLHVMHRVVCGRCAFVWMSLQSPVSGTMCARCRVR